MMSERRSDAGSGIGPAATLSKASEGFAVRLQTGQPGPVGLVQDGWFSDRRRVGLGLNSGHRDDIEDIFSGAAT